jgi:hypothetical protein
MKDKGKICNKDEATQNEKYALKNITLKNGGRIYTVNYLRIFLTFIKGNHVSPEDAKKTASIFTLVKFVKTEETVKCTQN